MNDSPSSDPATTDAENAVALTIQALTKTHRLLHESGNLLERIGAFALMPTTPGPTATAKRIDVLAASADTIRGESNFCIPRNDLVTLNRADEDADDVSGAHE